MESTVEEIAKRELHAAVNSLQPLTGGAQNIAYRLGTRYGDHVVRLNRDYLPTYAKEQWAMAQAAAVGVPVPRVHAVGHHAGYDYILMDWVPGTIGTDYRGADGLFRELGRHAQRLATIPVEGYGWDMEMSPYPCFTRSWAQAVDKDRDYIFGGDTLAQFSVMDAGIVGRVRAFMDEYREWTLPPRLSHNDLCLDNVIVGEDDVVTLIDWANACGQPSPLFEIARVGGGVAEPDRIWPFAAGHGLSESDWRNAVPTINRLQMVHALRAVVWAAQDAPGYLDGFVARAQTLIGAFT